MLEIGIHGQEISQNGGILGIKRNTTSKKLIDGLNFSKEEFLSINKDGIASEITSLVNTIKKSLKLSGEEKRIIDHIIINETSSIITLALYFGKDDPDTCDRGYEAFKKLMSLYKKLISISKDMQKTSFFKEKLTSEIVMCGGLSEDQRRDSLEDLEHIVNQSFTVRLAA